MMRTKWNEKIDRQNWKFDKESGMLMLEKIDVKESENSYRGKKYLGRDFNLHPSTACEMLKVWGW